MSGDGWFLEGTGLQVGYGGRPVLDDVNVSLGYNEVLCLIGHNGAGKSTLLKSFFGLAPLSRGVVKLDGKVISPMTPKFMNAAGVAMVPEGRGVFPGLTVEEIMRLGFWAAGIKGGEQTARLDWVFEVLPMIKRFYHQRAGTLSGGQQQMVSLGRALLSQPRCLLLDEPSIGLAPKLFQDLLGPIKVLQQERQVDEN